MASTTDTPALRLIECEPEPRLVNCYQIHGLVVGTYAGRRIVEHDALTGADGDPNRALRAAIRARADGLLIVDVRTGERWYVPLWQVEQLQREIMARLDTWHREQGHTFCWCGRWVHPDDLYEGTCGGAECLRNEADDRAGLVP